MPDRLFRPLLIALLALMVIAMIGLAGANARWALTLDNVHWTCSFLAAWVMTRHGLSHAPDEPTRLARRWIARGALALVAGQLVWNLMGFMEHIPLVNLADPFFLLVGPMVAWGLWRQLASHVDETERRAAALDALALLVAMLSATLALFLPRQGDASLLQVAVLAAYPFCMTLPTVLGAIVLLKLRARLDWRACLLPLSTLGLTMTWGAWNLQLLQGQTQEGGLVNICFSFIALVFGLGGMVYRIDPSEDPRWDRRCEGILRMLPLMLVLLSALGVWLGSSLPNVPPSARVSVQIGAVIVTGIAFMRQAVQLRDRDRLIVAERLLRQREQELEARVQERTRDLVAAREAAEAASQAKSDFLANMSHEIRTPLNGVLGFAQLATLSTRDPVLLSHMDRIQLAGKQLLRLINDILDMSKIEAGRLALESIPFELRGVLRSVEVQMAYAARAKGLSLSWRIEPEADGGSFLGDPLRVEQILLNYVGNAIKFTAQGSVDILVKAEPIDPIQRATGAGQPDLLRLRIEVHDTGVGMDEATRERLFAAFEQADNSTTRRFGGTGLGLAICKRLAGMMGGEVGVSSQPGVGSCFWVSLPLLRAVDQACAPESAVAGDVAGVGGATGVAAQAMTQPARLLLVEDNELNELLACSILEQAGYAVRVARTGREALELLAREPFACVLMDVQMPDMDGITATRALRAGPYQPDVPVIAMTANARSDDRQACLQAGMDDFVSKPLDAHRMLARVAQWVRLGAARRESTRADVDQEGDQA